MNRLSDENLYSVVEVREDDRLLGRRKVEKEEGEVMKGGKKISVSDLN